mgnify:CR=1 FL=1
MRRNLLVRFKLALALTCVSQPTVLLGGSQKPLIFADVTTFRCEFGDGEGRSEVDGRTENRRGDKFSDPLMIDAVNYRGRTARLIGNAGGSDLVILNNSKLALTFAEFTDVGGVSTITIFKRGGNFDLHHRAVMSRHLVFTTPNGLSMTQYYGTCRGMP